MAGLRPGFILTGPPASGKSARLRDAFLANPGAMMLVPTATMARHVRHELARGGAVVRPNAIRTLAEFTSSLNAADAAPEIPPGALVLLVRQCLRDEEAAWGASARTAGFQQAAANTISELDARGYSAADVLATARLVEDPPPEPMAFLRFFARVEERVRAAGFALRSWRLRAATTRAFTQPEPVPLIAADGFFSFTEPELGLLNALRRWAEVRISLPDWPGAGATRQRLLQLGFAEWPEAMADVRASTEALFSAGGFDGEVREIARRIRALRGQGVAYREMGIVLRDEKPYAAAIAGALESLGIPSRRYFVQSLDAQPLFRYLAALAAAARAEWDHEAAVQALRHRLSGLGGTPEGDELDFEIRRRLPSSGLEPLLMLEPRLETWARFDAWWRTPAPVAEIAAGLKAIVRQLAVDGDLTLAVNHQASQRAALLAIDEAARLTQAVSGATFWDDLATVAGFTPVREPDERRDVVHILDVFESRQWRLPYVFCPGLLEGRFPQHASDDPLLPDRFRQRLCELGLPVRTLGERQEEEDFLFEVARTRASVAFTASYPRLDAKGEATLPSFFLEGMRANPVSENVRYLPWPSHPVETASVRTHLSRPAAVAAKHRSWSPSRIESFLQCPYQFFGRHTLKLHGVPPRPEDRLDRLAQGSLVHEVLAFWQKDASQPIAAIFERLFTRACRERNARPGYLLEMARLEMLRHLREFAKRFSIRDGWRAEYEVNVSFTLDEGVDVRARIDRVDVSPAREAAVFDFKYSGGEAVRKRVRDHEEFPMVQGGLYLMGLEQTRELTPHSFHYVALRDEAKEHGWDTPSEVRAIMTKARELTLDAVARIREGEIQVSPRDEYLCAFCDFRDACRVAAVVEKPAVKTA